LTHEQLSLRYRPKQVRVLFVGESPPASGRFFYAGDSGLYRAMLRAFQGLDPAINDETFLEAFQACGCYLLDLCPHPVDRMARAQRRAECQAGEEMLARAIARMRPQMIVTMLRSIEDNVANAVSRTNWSGPLIHVPYPGRWAHLRAEFVERLTPVIAAVGPGTTRNACPEAIHSAT
jgi:hypothetical protein